MKPSFAFALILFLLYGCGTSPTSFQKEKKGEGYSDSTQGDLRISMFKANQYTKPGRARLFAEFHAIQNCRSEGYKFANVIDIFDKSESKQVTKTDSTGPAYYGSYGMYPFYSRYSGFGMGVGFGTTSSRSWNETYVYPKIEVPYTCANAIYRPKMMFEEVSADKMKHLVKDVKGAIQIQKMMEDSPNQKNLMIDDIILRVNGVRVEHVYELISAFDEKHTSVKVELLRDGDQKTAIMKAADISVEAREAEGKTIADACKQKSVQKKYSDTLCKK